MDHRPNTRAASFSRRDRVVALGDCRDMRLPTLSRTTREPLTDEDEVLKSRALEGDVGALLRWRRLLEPIDYEELGWGD